MLITDFTKKPMHVAVALAPDRKQLLHQDLIYNPEWVFAKINQNAESYFAEFFQTGREYRLFCLQTEMRPGELVKVFIQRFKIDCSVWIGGIIAPFTIRPADMNCFCQELAKKQGQFLKSKEKKIFTRTHIPGLTVKV